MSDADLLATDVTWDLDPLLGEAGSVEALLDEADTFADRLEPYRGRIADLSAAELAEYARTSAELQDRLGRAGNYAQLRYAADMTDEAKGAVAQMVQERAVAIGTRLLFFELEWVEVPEEQAAELLADPQLDFVAHHLRSLRRYRPHVLTEPEERISAELGVTGASAWVRLFDDLASAITVEIDGEQGPLEQGLSLLASPDRDTRRQAAEAVTEGLAPGLRTRAYVFNTLLADKATDDRLRDYPSWISSRNLSNEATDASVQALVDAVVDRYEIARRWYRLKERILGYPLADYDRMASLAESDQRVGWGEATDIVVDAYQSFSPELADGVRRFLAEGWIDAPASPGKRPGAFCAYTVPSHHPVPVSQLDWAAPRCPDPRPRARPRVARAARRAPRHLPPDHPAHPGRDSFRLWRDRHLRSATRRHARTGRAPCAVGRVHRGLDRHRLPPDRDEPLRTRRAHRTT